MFGFLKKESLVSVDVNELENLIGQIELIDVREPHEFKAGSIQTAKNIPMGSLLARPESYMDKRKTYYIMCLSGGRSKNVSKTLLKQGFSVVNVSGGMMKYSGKKRK